MQATGFSRYLGADNFLREDDAIEHLFNKVLDPAICIYESGVRVFRECQNLPRPDYAIQIPLRLLRRSLAWPACQRRRSGRSCAGPLRRC